MENLSRDRIVRASPFVLLASLTLISLSGALANLATAAPHVSPHSAHALDKQVTATLESLAYGDLDQARVLARQLALQFPRFTLGQLLSAELEATASFSDVRAAGIEPMSHTLINLLLEAQARGFKQAGLADDDRLTDERLPKGVIQIGKHQGHLLIIDLSQSVLYQLATNTHSERPANSPRLIRQHYVSSGKAGFGKLREGDNKTPLGIYRISGSRTDASLPELYGTGALMLDYPNALDRYLGRTGSGIWLHGIPRTQRSRAPRSSEGCVTMSNDHLSTLMRSLDPDETVVMLTQNVTWIEKQQIEPIRIALVEAFERYQQAYVTGDQTLLHSLFKTPEMWNIDAHMASELARVNASDISLFADPGPSGHVVMSLRFGSHNEHQVTVYWAKGIDNRWRVATEHWDSQST